MTESALVLKKLGLVRDHVLRLRERRRPTLEEFARSRDLQDATGMSFIAAMQEAIDIALHLVAQQALGMPGAYAEAFSLLARNGILDPTLGEQLGDLVRVRNRIVHGYASVDFERFWRELPAGIAALEEYCAAIATWLGRSTGP
jgi:uncharacterized protein YutE (UPF0331/DUF86 family)